MDSRAMAQAAGVALLCAAFGPRADHIPEIIVLGEAIESHGQVELESTAIPAPDSAVLMQRVPGGNVNYNGPLSGQTQYRGMFGPRMNVRIDDMYIHAGGPNWMDPPLHYLPAVLIDGFDVVRGIAPVSSGSGIGGYVEARTIGSAFTDRDAFTAQGYAGFNAHSVDGGRNFGLMAGLANERHRFHVLGATETGDDADFGDGTIAATEYARDFYGVGYGFKWGAHEFSFDARHSQTDDSGNPSLPLDLSLFDSDFYRLGYRGMWNRVVLRATVYHSRVDHRMTNYLLRPAPDFSALPLPPFNGTDRRFVEAESDGLGWMASAAFPLAGGELTLGSDGHNGENTAGVFDPDFAPFFVTNFNDAETDEWGVFAEWRTSYDNRWGVELGMRYDRVDTDAGPVDAFPAQIAGMFPPGSPPQAVRALRDRFNVLDRSRRDDNVDVVAKLGYALDQSIALELGFARKTRSPGYAERYLWIPLEVNSGLGDGNNYVGDVDLEAEVSHQLEFALDWRTERHYLQPRVFYRRVDDYIQGVPVAMTPFNMPIIGVSANANGDPTPLQFANVDAELYGLDAAWGVRLTDAWRIDGVIGYVRGKRRDVDDDLFRIAPLNARLAVSYERPDWFVTAEAVFYARQDDISQTITDDPANANNSSAETPGYGILNVFGQYRVLDGKATLSFGCENVFDKHYVDHLAGFNRVAGSDVPIGRRLPGRGRNVFANLAFRWE